MKLYEIPRGSKIKIKLDTSGIYGKDAFITFHNIDGLFSYCTINDGNQISTIQLSITTELKKVGNYYIIAENKYVTCIWCGINAPEGQYAQYCSEKCRNQATNK